MTERFAIMAGVLLLASGCSTSTLMTREPPAGSLKSGQVVYINDGFCPAGQVRRVVGAESFGASRQRSCVVQ